MQAYFYMLIYIRTILLPAAILMLSGMFAKAETIQRFQQKVDHYLTCELDDVRHVLTCTDSMVYYNRSPDTLRHIFFHLWPEGIQPGSALSENLLLYGDGSLNFAGKSETGSMTGVVFRVDGRGLRWVQHDGYREIYRVDLASPLLPDSHIVINIMFRLQMPSLPVADLSHDRQAYFLAHWFPRPAVYNAGGWQIMPLHQKGRLNGEFGNFDVKITLPRNYIVATSGIRDDNPDEEKFKQSLLDKTRKINRWGKRESAGFPASNAKTKTLRFTRNNVSDFALCLDKRFQFLQDTLINITGAGDTEMIILNLYFTVYEAEFWSNAMPVLKNAIRYMIHNAGEYPYESISLVQTAWLKGGKAYPGMIRIGSVLAPFLLEQAIIEGVADHWFNAEIAVDHYQHPWLGRGLPEYYALQYIREYYPDSVSLQNLFLDPAVRMNIAGLRDIPFNRLDYYMMLFLISNEYKPLMLRADQFSQKEYTAFTELKSSFAFSSLAGSMGEEQFRMLIRKYYEINSGKIASPESLKSLITAIAGEETSLWFNHDLLMQPEMPDYRILQVKRTPEGFSLEVQNVAGIAVPYPVTRITPQSDFTTWFAGHNGESVIHFSDTGHVTGRFVIDKEYLTPEINRRNNSIRTKGLFKRVEPVRLIPVIAAPNPYRTNVILSPVIGWNVNNGIMAGIASYSNPVIKPKTEYLIMPLYGFNNGHPAGTARLLHTVTLSQPSIVKLVLGAEIKRYGLDNKHFDLSWNRIMPYIEVHLKHSARPDKGRQMIRFRSVIVGKDSEVYDYVARAWEKGNLQSYVMNEIMWRHRVNRIINPFTLQAAFQQCGGTLRLITENNFLFSYNKPDKGFSIRLYGGIMLLNNGKNQSEDFKFTTAGIANYMTSKFDMHDPWFDNIYLSRYHVEGILRQHFYITDGGFKRVTTIGNNKRWMFTANLSTTMPGLIPFDLWLDAGLFADVTKDQFFGFQFLYSAGVKLSIIRNVAEIYFPFPFAESKSFADYEKLDKIDRKYINQIRFVLNLHHLNPLTLPGKVRIK